MMACWDWPNLKKWIKEQAPVQTAAGDITEIKQYMEIAKEQDITGLDYAISMAFLFPAEVLNGIEDGPTLLYKHTYQQLNYLMDKVALCTSLWLQQDGHRALAVPASQVTEWEKLLAHVNHRQVAVHLGQGWYGRNNILVTPDWGAQVRLVTVLTDAPFNDPGPWAEHNQEMGCGKCRKCVVECPVKAIHNGPQDFDRDKCAQRTREFERMKGVGQRICGVCIKACKGPAGVRE